MAPDMGVTKAGPGPEFRAPEHTVPFDRTGLAAYLRAQGLRFDPAEPIRQFAGGLANRNYLVTVEGRPTVLRRPPGGALPPGAHDMAREHRVMSGLRKALPFVPESLHFCPDLVVLGVPFQLIAFQPGLVLRGAELGALADRPGVGAHLSAMLVQVMAELHAVNAEAVGLADLGRPDGFANRAIAGWTRRGRRVTEGTAASLLVDEVSAWLERQAFTDRSPALLHCDLKFDNLILDPVTLQTAAVVDWDMGTRGNTLFDLATALSYWAEPGDPACMTGLGQMPTTLPGFWTRAEAAHHYAALTGTDLADLPAFRVLALLKLGVVFRQLHAQWAQGSVHDRRYERFGQLGEELLAYARDVATGRETPL